MTSDVDAILDDLLRSWHFRCQLDDAEGYYRVNPACLMFRSSRQYDDSNGALDSDNRNTVLEAFDAAVFRLEQPYLYAIQVQARNLATGSWVWRHPRLPEPGPKLAEIVSVARRELMRLYPVSA
jgi:hypothetical protein